MPRGPKLQPSRSLDDDTTSSPMTACTRCRKQKLRCSRDLPTCKRCKDISATCEYPPPPDRKLLAAQRLQNTKARANRESESYPGLQHQRSLSELGNVHRGIETAPAQYNIFDRSNSIDTSERGSQSINEEYQVTTPPYQTVLKRTNMPSPELAMFLIEIYFTHLYNAHFLFHKETFLADYAANRVPDFVALSIFASASIFMCQAPEKSHHLAGGDGDGVEFGLSMLSAADWSRQGADWANAASQRALMQADIPSVEVIQACQCLAIYWWAVGEQKRTHIHSHNTYMNARLLGLHVQTDTEDSFADEVRRRLYWASWMSQCIGQENAGFKAEPWKDAIGLKLPSEEELWHSRRPSSTEVFDDEGNIVNIDGSEVIPIPSEKGELIKLLGLWWEVQRFLQLPCEDTVHAAGSKIAELLELDRRLQKVFDDLHPHLQYVNATTFTSPKLDKYRVFEIHTLYRSINCALHSSIVPLFANSTVNPYISKKAVRLSAEQSVKHAAIILDMATAFMSSRPDISRLQGMVGFAMFIASTIQFKSLRAQRKLQTYGTGRFKAAVVILDRQKEYWETLQGSWFNLKILFSTAGVDIDAIPMDPRYQFSPDDQNTDLDKIVSHEGTPQSGDGAALYSYVGNAEAQSGASSRRGSEGYAHSRRTKSAQNTPSPGSIAIHIEGQEHTLAIHQRQEGQIQPGANVYTTPQPHLDAQPRSQPFEQQPLTGAGTFRRQSVGTMGAHHFVPLGPVPENYQAHASIGVPSRNMPVATPGNVQGMDAFGNMPGNIGTEMEVDRMNFWWDQSYGTVDMEVIDPNASFSGDGYPFQNFSFGSGFQ